MANALTTQKAAEKERLSYEEFRHFVQNMPLDNMRILGEVWGTLVAIVLKCDTEKEAVVEIVKSFYRMHADAKFNLVKSAFEEEADNLMFRAIRNLVYELPEDHQQKILRGKM